MADDMTKVHAGSAIPSRPGMVISLVLAALGLGASLILMPPGLLIMAGPAAMLPLGAGLLGLLSGLFGMRAVRGRDQIEAMTAEAAFGPRAWTSAVDHLSAVVAEQQQFGVSLAAEQQRCLYDAQQAGLRLAKQAADLEQRLLSAASRAERAIQTFTTEIDRQDTKLPATPGAETGQSIDQSIAEISVMLRRALEAPIAQNDGSDSATAQIAAQATEALHLAAAALADQSAVILQQTSLLQQEAEAVSAAGRLAASEALNAVAQLADLGSQAQNALQALPGAASALSLTVGEATAAISASAADLNAQAATLLNSQDRTDAEAAAMATCLQNLEISRDGIEKAHTAWTKNAETMAQAATRSLEKAAVQHAARCNDATAQFSSHTEAHTAQLSLLATTLSDATVGLASSVGHTQEKLAATCETAAERLQSTAAKFAEQGATITESLKASGQQAMNAARATLLALPQATASVTAAGVEANATITNHTDRLVVQFNDAQRQFDNRMQSWRQHLHQTCDGIELKVAALGQSLPQAAETIATTAYLACVRLQQAANEAVAQFSEMLQPLTQHNILLMQQTGETHQRIQESVHDIRSGTDRMLQAAQDRDDGTYAAGTHMTHLVETIANEVRALQDISRAIAVNEDAISAQTRELSHIASYVQQDLASLPAIGASLAEAAGRFETQLSTDIACHHRSEIAVAMAPFETAGAAVAGIQRSASILNEACTHLPAFINLVQSCNDDPRDRSTSAALLDDIVEAAETVRAARLREQDTASHVLSKMDDVQQAVAALAKLAEQALNQSNDGTMHRLPEFNAKSFHSATIQVATVQRETQRLRVQSESLAEAMLNSPEKPMPPWLPEKTPEMLRVLESSINDMRSAATSLALASDGTMGCAA